MEGKDLLLKIIEEKLHTLEQLDTESLKINDVPLITILNVAEKDIENFSNMSDEIIEQVVDLGNVKKANQLKSTLKQARDLLVGRRDYNLKVNLTPEYVEAIETFKDILKNKIESAVPGAINYESIEESCRNLQELINGEKIIHDFKMIEELVKEYNYLEFDNNMVIIMKFINNHNLSILKTPKKNAPIFDIQYIKRPKLDDRIKEILDKLEIDVRNLPNYLLSELKKCDAEEVYETFSLVKKNKAEDYGILHLINKENNLAKLVLILYATPTSVKEVVDSLKDAKGKIDIYVLKILVNQILSSLLSKSNIYFKPKYLDFMGNITLLKSLGVNYRALLNKCPLFMLSNNEVLNYTLNYLEQHGANKKKIVNKCYKTLALEPSILIENIDILVKNNIDMEYYFGDNANYNLLKVKDLEQKLKYLIAKNNLTTLDIDLLNKLLIGKVYRDSFEESITWGE